MKKYTVPSRDFQKREYFMVEADTSIEEVRKEHPSWKYEYLDRAVGKYHVFSLPKQHEEVSLLRRMAKEGRLEKRDGQKTLRAVYMLPEKKLERRAPVPEEYWEEESEENEEGSGEKEEEEEESDIERKEEEEEESDIQNNNLDSKKRKRTNVYKAHEMKEIGNGKKRIRNPEKSTKNKSTQHRNSQVKAHFPRKVTDSSQLVIEKARAEFGIDDPQFSHQWHIVNSEFPGEDVDVLPVWRQNITGKGVVTAIIDDGLDFENPDLEGTFCAEGSWDYNDNTALPRPRLQDDYHGTRCAGEIAATLGNGFCGVGVAYGSKVSGVRILSGSLTAEDEAAAMVHALDVNDIYSCSWGPPDNGRAMDVPDKIVREAILKGVQEGRGGKGALYVFASGNGALHKDSCNFDGYTNSIYSITVTAIDHRGLHPGYAESCAAVMVSTYSSGSGEHIATTDFKEGCSARHGGTSAAAPLAAGLYALVLEANPALTWRDVQQLTVLAAVQVHADDPDWHESAIPGRKYSYTYGWGKLDAAKIVHMARTDYQLLKPQAWYYTPYLHLGSGGEDGAGDATDDGTGEGTDDGTAPLVTSTQQSSPSGDAQPWPDGSLIYSSAYDVADGEIGRANLDHVEQITVTVDISASKRGAVYIRLVSPHGIVSRLAQQRPHDNDESGFNNWTFSSVAHWGEKPAGTWTIQVINTEPDKQKVAFHGWQLRLFGECIDPSRATKFDMDRDYSEEDLDSAVSAISQSGPATVSAISSATPTSSTLPSASSTTALLASSMPSSSTHDNSEAQSHLLPKDHVDIYFLALLLIGFAVCMWMLKCRKKPGRARQRDEYEFEIINPDEEDSDFDHNSHFQRSVDLSEAGSGDLQTPAAKSANDVHPEGENSTQLTAESQSNVQNFGNSYAEDNQSAFDTAEEERERLFNTSNGDDLRGVSDDEAGELLK